MSDKNETFLSLKVDVDTLRGYREGVPRMLDLFERLGIRASIFFSFGPDNSGKAIRRIFRKGFLTKMLRTKAPSTYGFKTLLYGTLLPAPQIVKQAPEILKRAHQKGHECGTHAWDHVRWQDELQRMDCPAIRDEFAKARKLFKEIIGADATSCAAPGWQVTAKSLEVQDELNLCYASDTRGTEPFYPRYGNKTFKTLQIPTTLPTLDELLGAPGMDDTTILHLWMDGMQHRFNVLTIHAEMEGLSKLDFLEIFLLKCLQKGVRFIALAEVAKQCAEKETPMCDILMDTLDGRAGTLAIQKNGGEKHVL